MESSEEKRKIRFFYVKHKELSFVLVPFNTDAPSFDISNGVSVQVTNKSVGCIVTELVESHLTGKKVLYAWSACSKKDVFSKDAAKSIALNRLNTLKDHSHPYGGSVTFKPGSFLEVLKAVAKNDKAPKRFKKAVDQVVEYKEALIQESTLTASAK